MGNWTDALARQAELASWWTKPEAESFALGFADFILKSGNEKWWSRPRRSEWPGAIPRVEREKMLIGNPYWVSADMGDVLDKIARGVTPHELTHADIPEHAGFVLFEEPLTFPDVTGEPQQMSAFAWRVYEVDREVAMVSNAWRGGMSLSVYGPVEKEWIRQGVPRLATLRELKEIQTVAEQLNLNRRWGDVDALADAVDAKVRYHVLVPQMLHRFAQGKATVPHVRALVHELIMRDGSTMKPDAGDIPTFLDIPLPEWERLKKSWAGPEDRVVPGPALRMWHDTWYNMFQPYTLLFDHEGATVLHKLVSSFFLLIQQEVFARYPQQAPRAMRRQWAREMKREVPSVKVVNLRRRIKSALSEDAESEGVGFREYTHRWIVNGHWRNQYYPSEGRHKPLWISPYVKGPDDKPLKVKKTVYRVVQ